MSVSSLSRIGASAREVLRSAIRDCAILRADDQRLISRYGTNNSWLIDSRRISLQAAFLDAIADLFWSMCGDHMPFQVGGMEVAAVPLLSAILMKSVVRGTPINGFVVRKERKTHGTGSLFEGRLTDEPIFIVDDICNSGASLEKVRVVLEEHNRTIQCVFVLIDYLSSKGKAWRTKHGIPVISPFTLSDFGLALNILEQKPSRVCFDNIWHFAAPDPNFYHRVPKSFPTVDGNRLYFGSDCGTFWCLNATNGSVVWTFQVKSRGHKNLWSSPVIDRGKVFFGSYDGNVYCLDANTGVELWRFIDADWVGSSPALAPDLGLLFIGLEFATDSKRGSIAALSMTTGEKIWEHSTRAYTHASPAYQRESKLVACGSNDNELLLFDAATGSPRWRFDTTRHHVRDGSIRHAPAFDIARGHLIAGCTNGYIYIIDIATGSEVWSVHTDNTVYTVPLIVGDTAYVGSTDKYLYILDLAHRQVAKKIYAGSKIFSPARLLNGRLYFGACNGLIYELDPVSNDVMGTHQLPDAITNAIAFSPDTSMFYALTYVNQVFAFIRREMPP